jgi:beta-phosphoglucomutase-like phosphatase (HAD superfamily)
MSEQVDTIVADHLSISTEAENFKKGKREDHDQLPEDIQALYVENLSLLQQMRELHLQLRNLSLDNVTCPDSERYPFLKELINLDKRMHANWDKYDHYILTDA